MLISFSVKNFRSFRDKVVLSLEPSSNTEHPNNVIKIEDNESLCTIPIYGANASGKTNVIRALGTAISTIRQSNLLQITDKLEQMVPFKFDLTSCDNPCEFELTFVAADRIKYTYGFSADQTQIHEEYLYAYYSAKPSMIFERNKEKLECGQTEKTELEPIFKRTTKNKLLLAAATAWNYEKTCPPFFWLAKYIEILNNAEQDLPFYTLDMHANDNTGVLKAFTTQLLQHADINICDYDVNVMDIPCTSATFPPEIAKLFGDQQPRGKQYRVVTSHDCGELGDAQDGKLDLEDESLGTKRLFFYSPLLYDALQNGRTFVIDELERSFHPLIVQYIIDLFQNPNINKNNAQLIFTTHNTEILTLDNFRRDQIYFIEKVADTGVSDLYSLDEFSVRKDENVRKGYLLGRFGAVPVVDSEGLIV